MRIEIRGRNVEMTDDLREMVRKRFQRLGRQVSPLATLEVVLSEERNPSIADSQVAEATFYLKGVTLQRARLAGDDPHRARAGRGPAAPGQEAPRPAAQAAPDAAAGRPDARPARRAASVDTVAGRSEAPGEGHGDDAGRAGRAQRLRAGGQRGAGGEHVVDQQDAAGRGGRRRGSAAGGRSARPGAGRPDGRRRGGPGRARSGDPSRSASAAASSPAGSKPRRRSRAGAAGTGTIAPLSMWAGASHWIRSAIRSATGSSRRNFSAATSSRATPS